MTLIRRDPSRTAARSTLAQRAERSAREWALLRTRLRTITPQSLGRGLLAVGVLGVAAWLASLDLADPAPVCGRGNPRLRGVPAGGPAGAVHAPPPRGHARHDTGRRDRGRGHRDRRPAAGAAGVAIVTGSPIVGRARPDPRSDECLSRDPAGDDAGPDPGRPRSNGRTGRRRVLRRAGRGRHVPGLQHAPDLRDPRQPARRAAAADLGPLRRPRRQGHLALDRGRPRAGDQGGRRWRCCGSSTARSARSCACSSRRRSASASCVYLGLSLVERAGLAHHQQRARDRGGRRCSSRWCPRWASCWE